MPSKYAKLASKLPAFEQEYTFQMKVDEFKKNFGDNTEDANISILAGNYASLRARKELLEADISEINIGLEALSQMIVENMQANEIDKVNMHDGSTVYVNYEVYPSVKDKLSLMDWIKKNKMSDALTLPWQTLRGLCNELSLNGKPLPKGVEAYMKVSARIRKNGAAE